MSARLTLVQCFRRHYAAMGCLIFLTCRSSAALSVESPEGFFTTVSDRLLQQQLGVAINQIQIAPTNQYDNAVHRIFQVTANIYDATSTNSFPTVYRPLFETRSNGVFLAGFTNDNRASTLGAWLSKRPARVPLIIAARKGFPNFNEFTLRTDVLTQRGIEVVRTKTAPWSFPTGTNQMFTLSLSNLLAVEVWNPYANFYQRALQLTVSNWTRVVFTNGIGVQHVAELSSTSGTNVPAGTWRENPGPIVAFARGLILPPAHTVVSVTNAAYRFSDNSFLESAGAFEASPGFPIPSSIAVVSNLLSYVATDGDNIIDFVQLEATSTVDIGKQLWTGNPYAGVFTAPGEVMNLWVTNRTSPASPPAGLLQQMDIALGNVPTSAGDWAIFGLNAGNESQKNSAIDAFRYFCRLQTTNGQPFITNNTFSMVAPFNPAARISTMTVWQVNDPLCHYRVNDLVALASYRQLPPAQSPSNTFPASLGRLNDSYSPWAGNPNTGTFPDASNRALKDPGVYRPQDWNFPTNETLNAAWLGRVHRGTPWQTIYLKADVASLSDWISAGGDVRTHPTNDWRMATLLASLFNTNALGNLTSVDETNLNVWAATLHGLTVFSNSIDEAFFGEEPQFDTIVVSSNASQVSTLVDDINQTRAQQEHYFAAADALFSVPSLSSASPWLNLTGDQTRFGITDEAYEALPSQLLSRVRSNPVAAIFRDENFAELRFIGLGGYLFHVESSLDLVTWTPVFNPRWSRNGDFSTIVPLHLEGLFFRAVLHP